VGGYYSGIGSSLRDGRLAACGMSSGRITGMRAQNFDFGAPELVELELYLMSRARGMPVETPAVRP
jgi:hypothetical protein